MTEVKVMKKSPIINTKPLGFQWETADPFLFCVHHEDFYPEGNNEMGPKASLNGRNIGQDFEIKDGWRMYHGDKVPGFPSHPHRGFETVTIVQKGFVDHADSLGAAGRYSAGDVQWLTAGKGIQHSEMFPLLHKDKPNTMELFQIWLNLPKKSKFAEPTFKMLWRETIPKFVSKDVDGNKVEIDVIAGKIEDAKAPEPPKDSWASDEKNAVAIWNIKMDPECVWTLPAEEEKVNRILFFFKGSSINIEGNEISSSQSIQVESDVDIQLKNGNEESFIVLLQGCPIDEPVAQYGPFVMNTQTEIQQAFADYQRTTFGGWPWPDNDPVHSNELIRFAKHADGKEEKK